MKVQTKILLLFFVLVAVFAAGLAWIRDREHARFRDIAHARAEESRLAFEAAIAHQSEALETFAKDSTYSDAMVHAVTHDDKLWINQTIDESTWAHSGAHAIWVYHPDRTLFYSANLLYADNLHDVPLPPAAFDALEKRRYLHFFLRTPQGVMAICAATIHPSNDSWRQTPPQGYFFTGQLWSHGEHGVIGDLARGTGNTVRLVPVAFPQEPPNPGASNDAVDGVISFSRALDGWDGKPVAWLLVRNESDTVKALNRANEQLRLLFVGFAFALLLVLGGSVVRWVSRPLRLISQTLKTEHLGPINKLRNDRSEFGGVAKLIHEFFGQRESLLAEIAERKHAQEALRQSGEQLRQAQKMEAVGRLAGGVAHDFNNLLTAILGYSELLAARSDLDDSSRQNVEMIQKAGRQAAAVTHQLLAFSRKQILQPRVIDLNTLVTDFEQILRRVIGEHIELCTRATAEGGRVRADPNQIEQVILNLGVNARDAMMPAGRPVDHPNGEREVRRGRRETRRAGPRAGAVRVAGGVRHGPRHGRRGEIAHLRAVLHDQGAGQGHGPGVIDGVRRGQAERGHGGRGQRAGGGLHVPHLPAAGERGGGGSAAEDGHAAVTGRAAGGDGARRGGRGDRARPGVRGVDRPRVRRALRVQRRRGPAPERDASGQDHADDYGRGHAATRRAGTGAAALRVAAGDEGALRVRLFGARHERAGHSGVGPGISGKTVHAPGAHAQGPRSVAAEGGRAGRRGESGRCADGMMAEGVGMRRSLLVGAGLVMMVAACHRQPPAATQKGSPPVHASGPAMQKGPPPTQVADVSRPVTDSTPALPDFAVDAVAAREGVARWYDVPDQSLAQRRAWPQEMTAASDVLPQNSYVRVRRLDGKGAPIVVRITDHGVHDRETLVDVSRVAAEALGMVKSGTARVRVETLALKNASADKPVEKRDAPAAPKLTNTPAVNQQAEKDAADAKTGGQSAP